MNLASLSRTDLIILGLLAPGVFLLVSAFIGSLVVDRNDHSDKGPLVLVLFIAGTTLGAGILSLGAFDRFWKVHLSACLALILPISIIFLISVILSGTDGYFWLGLTVMIFLLVIAVILTLPLNAIVYSVLRSVRARREASVSSSS